MKNRKWIIGSIILLSILSILFIILLFFLLNGRMKFFSFPVSSTVSKELVLDQTYDSSFQQVKVDADAADIDIKPSSDQKVRVVIYGDEDETTVDTDYQILSIVSKQEPCTFFCFSRKVAKIEVYLPSNFDQLIEVHDAYGDVTIDEFLASNIVVEENCGAVLIKGGNQVKVDNDYGDVEIKRANDIDIKESAGDVIIGKVSNATIRNSYGDIQIKEVLNFLDIQEDCGDVEINRITLKQDSKISNSYGSIRIGYTNEVYMDAKTDLGDVKIKQNFPKADVTLKLDNSCGDIEVDN